jgi:hypothetical protein
LPAVLFQHSSAAGKPAGYTAFTISPHEEITRLHTSLDAVGLQ